MDADRWGDRLPRIRATLFLYRRAVIAGVVFIALNAVDGYLANVAYQRTGTISVEANPFLQPFLGHWALGLKGILGIGILALFAWWRKLSPDRVLWWTSFSCVVFLGIILWNMKAMGIL